MSFLFCFGWDGAGSTTLCLLCKHKYGSFFCPKALSACKDKPWAKASPMARTHPHSYFLKRLHPFQMMLALYCIESIRVKNSQPMVNKIYQLSLYIPLSSCYNMISSGAIISWRCFECQI